MKDKSVVLALVLTFFLARWACSMPARTGAVALIVLAAVGVVPTLGYVLIFVWPASMVWAAIAANNRHNAFLAGPGLTP